MIRTLTAPGVDWFETDKSEYSPTMNGTACYIPVFTSKGEPYQPKEFTSRAAWTNYYGEPETEAERYSYAAICEVLNQGGRLYTAKLPYDNDSYNKVVGSEWTVTPSQTFDSLIASDANLAPLSSVKQLDPTLDDIAVVRSNGYPALYSLTEVNKYREKEKKVKANSIVIVDTTGSTYDKIEEDSRKNDKRELLGIIPVITTAANALYAQKMISLELNEVSAYEPINLKYTNGLSATEDSEDYKLYADDLMLDYNTQGRYQLQKYTFNEVLLSGYYVPQEEIELGDTFGEWRTTILKFIEDYKLEGEYNVNSLYGMKQFHDSIDTIGSKITDKTRISDVKVALTNVMEALVSDFKWYECDSTGKVTTKEVSADQFAAYVLTYNKFKDNILFADDDYIDSHSIITDYSGRNATATLHRKQALENGGEWHGVDGDDSVPATMSLDAAQFFNTIQPNKSGEGLDHTYLKDIGVVVFKTYLDPTIGNKVAYEAVESFVGSLYKDDIDETTGYTRFIDTIVNTNSKYINLFSNCFNASSSKSWYVNECDLIVAPPSTYPILGMYSNMTEKNISLNKTILQGLNTCFELVKDINKLDIDIVCDAGIANVGSFVRSVWNGCGPYDMDATDSAGNSLIGAWTCKKQTDEAVVTWKEIESKFDTFCKSTRKDCMFIADGLRPLVIQGQQKVVRDTKPESSLDSDVLPYLQTICGLNTSYGAGYCNWFLTTDDYSGNAFWCPPSIKAMGSYINCDLNFNYWDAPAGMTRGVIAASDASFSPTPSQAGIIYQKNWNYAVDYPNEGIILEGQKTFQVKTTAFDRVNVRRLFLRLERASFKAARYFVYEGNTAYTRQRLVDAIDPYFKSALAGGGIYGYKIICDETNNTSDTIDANELHISIGIQPTKTIEYIYFNFVAGRTGASWEEMMS